MTKFNKTLDQLIMVATLASNKEPKEAANYLAEALASPTFQKDINALEVSQRKAFDEYKKSLKAKSKKTKAMEDMDEEESSDDDDEDEDEEDNLFEMESDEDEDEDEDDDDDEDEAKAAKVKASLVMANLKKLK